MHLRASWLTCACARVSRVHVHAHMLKREEESARMRKLTGCVSLLRAPCCVKRKHAPCEKQNKIHSQQCQHKLKMRSHVCARECERACH